VARPPTTRRTRSKSERKTHRATHPATAPRAHSDNGCRMRLFSLLRWSSPRLPDGGRSAPYSHIHMNADGLPVVDPAKCTACGDCVDACPRNLFDIQPLDQRLILQCSAPLAGDEAMALCSVACDACGRCAQDAPGELVRIVNNLPVIDYAKGGPASAVVAARCPTGAITWLEGAQFAHQEPGAAPWRSHV